MKTLLLVTFLMLEACSTKPVQCDAHLSPINPPSKPSSGEGTHSSISRPAVNQPPGSAR